MDATSDHIVVIAHRGAHEHAPENTLPAYRAAIALGVEYIEVDIRQTKDGAFVCIHNDTVDARTNGKGRVREMTLAEIRALDAGSWFDPSFAGTQVPTTDEALALIRGKAGVYLDVKDAPPESVVAILRQHEMLASTLVYAEPEELAAMRRVEPSIRAMPEYPGTPEAMRALARRLHPEVVAISSFARITPEAVEACHDVGAEVHVDIMAHDDPEGWQYALNCGVDGLQTDRPEALLRFLRERELHR